MRIVLLSDRIPPEGRGGAESVVWRLAHGLQAAGHDVHIIAATSQPAFEEVRDGIPTYHLHADYPLRFRAWLSLWNPQTIGAFRQLLRRLKPDIVNAHNIHFYLSWHSLKIAREAGIGTVFSSHDVMPFAYGKLWHFVQADSRRIQLPSDYRLPRGFNLRQNRFRYNPFRNSRIRHYLKACADVRTAPSQALADALAANRLPAFEVAHNGIDASEWSQVDADLTEKLRRRLDLVDKQVILIAGRLSSHKGTAQLLAAMDRLVDVLPNMRLLALTAGDIQRGIPAAYQHLRPLIRAGGWLTGDELRAAYHLADVVAAPSIYCDPFPTVNLEAMAAGKPVIATCFGGSPELVADGETGIIINPLDTELFADALRRLLGSPDLRREMGRKGQERVRRRFSLDHQARRMTALYERAIG